LRSILSNTNESGAGTLNIEVGKLIHCTETVTGKNLTGTLLVGDDEIRAELYSYGEHFHIASDQPIYFTAKTGEEVSFHSNIDGGSGTTTYRDRRIHRLSFISNVAVVGHNRWTETDVVKRAAFTDKHSLEVLRHQEKFRAVQKADLRREDDLSVLNEETPDMTLRAWYGAAYGMYLDAPKDVWPMFEIEFNRSVGINEYIEHVSSYVQFLSFCLGAALKPDKIQIDRLSRDEMMAAIKTDSYFGRHDVRYVWPEQKLDPQDLWVGGSPVRAWNDEELFAFRACLVAWIGRAGTWKRAYIMMMTSFALKNVMSAERLINACRWLEEIPTAQSKNAISSKDIDEISTAATLKANQIGYSPVIHERIANAIKRIKAESSETRFTRLVATIEEKFGKGILPEKAVAHLKRAIQFRGRTAHGHFKPTNDKEFAAFVKSTRAMEALCYLLTALDLPISTAGLGRTGSNPIVRDYRDAFE
jgi:hypothetical protein